MRNIVEELTIRNQELDIIERKASSYLKNHTIDGRISTSVSNGVTQYYYHNSGDKGTGTYIRKENINVAEDIIMYNYNQKVLSLIMQWKRWIDRTLSSVPSQDIADVYTLAKGRKALITPYEISNEDYKKAWLAQEYETKPFSEETPEIYTEKGERVRSKSEKLIADKLYMLNIPYRYEYPVNLMGYGVVYPDFTLLNVNTRHEIIYEHFGMMDDATYATNAVRKINNYLGCGYRWGVDFVVTFETKTCPIDVRIIDGMLQEIKAQKEV